MNISAPRIFSEPALDSAYMAILKRLSSNPTDPAAITCAGCVSALLRTEEPSSDDLSRISPRDQEALKNFMACLSKLPNTAGERELATLFLHGH